MDLLRELKRADEYEKELRAEIVRLRGLVEQAYLEGYVDGEMADHEEAEKMWNGSNAKRELEKEHNQ